MQEHISSVHENIRPFKCDICNESLHSKKQFQCEICGIDFTSRESLKRHIEAVHEEKKPFKCNICHKSFVNLHLLSSWKD